MKSSRGGCIPAPLFCLPPGHFRLCSCFSLDICKTEDISGLKRFCVAQCWADYREINYYKHKVNTAERETKPPQNRRGNYLHRSKAIYCLKLSRCRRCLRAPLPTPAWLVKELWWAQNVSAGEENYPSPPSWSARLTSCSFGVAKQGWELDPGEEPRLEHQPVPVYYGYGSLSGIWWDCLAGRGKKWCILGAADKKCPGRHFTPGWGVKERAAASLQVSCPRQFVLHLLSYKFTRTHVLNLETSTFSGIHILWGPF